MQMHSSVESSIFLPRERGAMLAHGGLRIVLLIGF